MGTQFVRLIDESRRTIAFAEVADKGSHYGGEIDLTQTPPRLRALFDEFEKIVNEQLFGFLDKVEGKIRSLRVIAIFSDGREARVRDLQVYPRTYTVSFKTDGLADDLGATGDKSS